MESNPIKTKVSDDRIDLYRDKEVCDFCGGPDVQYTAFVTKGSVIETAEGTVSVDDWAVCPICAEIVKRAGDGVARAELLHRSVATFPPERAPDDGLTRMVLQLHTQFWQAFEGIEKNS